jgi:TolA-binding protein
MSVQATATTRHCIFKASHPTPRLFLAFVVAVLAPATAMQAQNRPSQAEGRNKSAANEPRSSISDGLNFANALLNEQRYELAVEEYERFLTGNRSNAERADALYGLARAQLFLRKYAEARQTLESFLKLAPDHNSAPSALFRLGEAAYLMNDLGSARQALERFVDAYPNHPQQQVAWPYLGFTRFELGELEAAEKALSQTISRYPKSPLAERARYTLARVFAAKGDTDRAIELLRELASQPNSDWFDRARVQIGQVQLSAKRYESALATFNELERSLPAGAQLADVRLRRAEALLGLNRANEAEPALRGLLSDPSASKLIRTQAALSLGAHLAKTGEPAQALVIWETALPEAPENLAPALLYHSAEVLEATESKSKALIRFQSIAEKYPADVWADEALLNAARIALELSDPSRALALCRQLNTRYPESTLAHDARLIEGRAAQLSGNDNQAISSFEALLKSENLSQELRQSALHYLSVAYKRANQPERAEAVLAELARSPATPLASNAQFALGRTHFDAGRFQQAASALDEFLSVHAQNELAPHAWAYLVLARLELGQAAEMRAALDRLQQDWPDSEPLARLRLRLGEAALDAQRFAEAAELFRPVTQAKFLFLRHRAQIDLGWSLLGLKQPAEAALVFSACLAEDRETEEAPAAAYLRGWALEQADRTDEALQAYTETTSSFPDRAEAVQAQLAQARLLRRIGKANDSATLLESSLREHAARLPSEESVDQLLFELGQVFLEAGQPNKAREMFERVIADHGASENAANARVLLAETAYRDKDFGAARELLRPLLIPSDTAVKSASVTEQALFRMGRIALEEKQLGEAKTHFAALLHAFPQGRWKDEARFWLAESMYRNGETSAAETEFAALIAPTDPAESPIAPWRDSARLRRIQCMLAQSRWKDVLLEAEQFLRDRPAFPQVAEVHYVRGRALSSQPLPDFEAARQAYQSAIDATPRSEVAARAQFMRGETYMHEKQFKAAVREFHQVELLYSFPKWQATALFEAGKAYESLGQKTDAIASYRKFLDTFPQDENASEVRRRLTSLAG